MIFRPTLVKLLSVILPVKEDPYDTDKEWGDYPNNQSYY